MSGHFPVSTLQLQFEENPATLTYLDDIQLERGLVANDYNLVENSSFKEGINSWNIVATDYDTGLEVTDNIYEIVSINESEKAIKINSIVNGGIVLAKSIEISGKSGDVYTISFWYKIKEYWKIPMSSRGISLIFALFQKRKLVKEVELITFI